MDEIPEFKNSAFELKWATHKKGEKKSSIGINAKAKTLAILISGKIRYVFPQKEHILAKQGDFVYWGAEVPHSWESIEDNTVTLSIRWPSAPGDQKSILGDLNRSQSL